MLRALVMPLPARARVRRPGRPGQSSSLMRVVSGVVATALALVGAVALAPVAQAAGTPDVAITVGAPTSALRGSTVPVTLTATNPGGPAGYNASFRMVLPVGASLNPPTQTGARTIAQADGSTVVLWDNVSDLLTGTTSSVTAQVSTGTLPLGPLTISGGAYVNTNPRLVPSFTALGAPNAGSSTGSATGTATIEVVPFTLTTDVAAPENELVRGVHDHRTTVELTIDNNYVGPSSAFTVTEYVPATLEFLGCGATAADGDSSAPGEEYPGSGRLNETDAALPGSCPVPSSVSTALVDPPGTQPLAVYTVVTWDNAALAAVGAGSLATGASKKIYYVVGVPQNANALFGGTAPTAASGDQGSNLDNNTGASTLETGEQQATTTAILSGSYLGTTYTDDGTDTVTLEDLAIQKSADHPVIVQGDASRWTLSIEVSEYTSAATDLVVTDTVPDGLCPQGAGSPDAECQGGLAPSPAYTSATENADGTWTLVWNLADQPSNATPTVSYSTIARAFYQQGLADDVANPVRANDSWTNTVGITGTVAELAATGRAVADVSGAGQQADGIQLVKQVAAPDASGVCGDGSGLTWQGVASTEFGPGDVVCWRLAITTPAGLDTSGLVLTDFLPAGYTVVDAATGAGSDLAFDPPAVDQRVVTWTFGATGGDLDQAKTAVVVLRSEITDPTAAEPVDIVENLAKLSYRNTAGQVFQLRAQADAPWREAVLTLTKTATPTTVHGQDVVDYTVAVRNDGDQTALDVSVRDRLPAQVACAELVPGSLTAGFSCSGAAGAARIDGTIASIAPGATATVTYQLAVDTRFAPGETLVNTAGVRTYQTLSDDGTRFTYVPSSNIDPALTPNTTPAIDTETLTLAPLALTKTATTSVTEAGNSATRATVGETVTYTVTATLPHGETLNTAALTDTLPAMLGLADNASATPPTVTVDGVGGVLTAVVTGNRVDVVFPASWATPTAADQVIVLRYTATVLDVAAARHGQTATNTVHLGFTDSDGTVVDRTAQASTPIVEPQVTTTLTETDVDDLASPGEVIGFTVTVGDTAAAATAHDVVVVDTIPTSMTPVDGTMTPLLDGQSVPSGGVWDLATRTLTWNSTTTPALATVAPGATVPLAYSVKVADPVPSPTSFTSSVTATTSSLAGATAGERVAGGVSPTRYSATAQVTLSGPRPSLTKTVTPGTAAVGEAVTFTVVATIPASVTTFDATVLDTLPAGLAYLDTLAATCTAPVGCAISPVTLTPSGQQLGWFLGDLPADAATRQVTITYRATVADVAAASAGAVLTNSAVVASNLGDVIAGTPATVPPAGGFTGTSTPATASVTVLEPHLTLVKTVAQGASQVDARRVLPGEVVTYTVTVTNTGAGTAHDVAIADVTDPRFTAVSVVSGAGWTVTDADPTDGTLGATASTIAPGASLAFTYQLRVPMLTAADEVPGAEITNTADATYSSAVATSPGPRRAYDDVPADSVTLEADLASLGDTVWYDADGNGIQGPGEPGVAGAAVTVLFAGADGVVGTGDDESHATTTAADGAYLVPNLPQGQYRVSVAGASLPGGTTVTSDLDGATGGLGVTTATLAGGQDRTDVDFAIRGTGAIGDRVWLDQDGDGAQGAGEPGLAGIGVDVTWAGQDGVLGTPDDVVIAAVTDATGTWSVTALPAGPLRVALDASTYPTGLAPVSERDAGPADGVTTGTLALGATDLAYDFGLRGTAQLGDRLWVDTDGDGVQEAGEPGIPGATVVVRWNGPDGAAGTVDDLVNTVVTSADGAYLVEHLPAGDYSVTVTSLPVALAPTSDEDDGTTAPDSRTVLTLTDGEVHLTADFGFVAATGVGDTVWLDVDGDGTQSADEPGLPGVEVTVTAAGADGVVGTADDIVRTTVTGADGTWLVTGLPAGPARVEVTGSLPGGLTPSGDADGTATPGVSLVTLVGGATDLDQDFGYVGASSIGDRAWVDLDTDGVQDAGEPGLGGLTFTVTYLGADGVVGGGDDVTYRAVTAPDGSYLVPGLPDGAYTVAVTAGVPAGYVPTWDETGAADATSTVADLGAGGPESHLTADVGFTGTGAIGGTVWLDRTTDGVLESPAEAGIAGIVVLVTWSGPDGVLGTSDDAVVTATTGPGGVWHVDVMPPGPFVAAVDPSTLPRGTSVVFDRESGLVAPDGTLTGTLAPGARIMDIDTGLLGTGAIGDLVWVDSNRDGVRGAGEPVVAGMRVTVTWLGPDGVLGTADDVRVEVTTDASGAYTAGGLPAGRYTVQFDRAGAPRGTVAFADLDGADPLLTTVDLDLGQVRTDADLVLRPQSVLAATGASVGGLLVLALLLVGGGLVLRRRATRRA